MLKCFPQLFSRDPTHQADDGQTHLPPRPGKTSHSEPGTPAKSLTVETIGVSHRYAGGSQTLLPNYYFIESRNIHIRVSFSGIKFIKVY